METARLDRPGPETYRRDVIERIAGYLIAHVAEFLPWPLKRSMP